MSNSITGIEKDIKDSEIIEVNGVKYQKI